MDEAEYWETLESDLHDIYHTARVIDMGGEHDFDAGQRNEVTQRYRLDLKASVAAQIEEERAESEDSTSDILNGLRVRLEDKLGLTVGEYDGGHLFVTATYDRRSEGSY